ncbi:MAG: ATP-binding protein, partial [Actinomycetota bacterium]|nr:ATP-binding protein [Actinomycetota bacterium]
DEDVDHLFEPFVRLAGARRLHGEGHGLGLAIVRSVADVHRAELHARARPQGGLAVSVTFPYRELPRA